MTCPCSSCAVRASWTPAQRDEFDRSDDAREARDLLGMALPAPTLEDLEEAARAPRRSAKPDRERVRRRLTELAARAGRAA
jgi:hypothetical protein